MKTLMNTKIFKNICAAFSLVMLCGMPFAETAYSVETEQTQQTDDLKPAPLDVSNDTSSFEENAELKKLRKIDERLCEILENAADDELIPVSIWIADIDFKEVEERVETEFGLSRNILDQKSDALRDDFVTAYTIAVSDNDFITAYNDYKELNKDKIEQFDTDVENYIIEQRNIAKEMITETSNAFVNTFLNDAEDVRVYEFFPVIDCSITKEKIIFLAALNNVESISYNVESISSNADAVISDCEVFERCTD